jgi:hypothetical protein
MRSVLAIQAPSAFQAGDNKIWRNGLLWGEADLEAGYVVITPKRWNDDHQAYVFDSDAAHPEFRVKNQDSFSFQLPGHDASRTAKEAPQLAPAGGFGDAESGRFMVLDGVTWNEFAEQINDGFARRLGINRQAHYMASFERACAAVLFSSSIGYHKDLFGLHSDHPVSILRKDWDTDRVVPVSGRTRQLEDFVLDPTERKVIEADIMALTPDRMQTAYEHLILREAEQYLGDDPSLCEYGLRADQYVFKKYLRNHDLLTLVPNDFVNRFSPMLVKSFADRTVPESRDAFIRQLMTTHLAIGHLYRTDVSEADNTVQERWRRTKAIQQAVTRTPIAYETSEDPTFRAGDVLRYFLPVCMRLVLEKAGDRKHVLEALLDVREFEIVRLARKKIAEIDDMVVKVGVPTARRRAEEWYRATLPLGRESLLTHGAQVRHQEQGSIVEDYAVAVGKGSLHDNAQSYWRTIILGSE